MVWVFGALSLLLLLALAAFLLKFRFALDIGYPIDVRGRFSLSFIGLHRNFHFGTSSESKPAEPIPSHRSEDQSMEPVRVARESNSPDSPSKPSASAARGLKRRPILRLSENTKARLRQSLVKWVMDIRVWGALGKYLLRLAIRVLRLLHPRLESIHFASRDVLALGRFAAFWSSLRGMFPALACPVDYGFNRPSALRLKVKGEFTGLGLLALITIAVADFPWFRLASRFLRAWRHLHLNRWQRFVYARTWAS